MGQKKVLIALTSYHGPFYPDGKKTGLYSVEALHPFDVFHANNYQVDFVSETGKVGYDEHSVSKDVLGNDWDTFQDSNSPYNVALKNIKLVSDVKASDYDAIYFAAGHGTLFDFPKAKQLQNLAAEIYANNGIVAAVCHGPAIFDGLLDKSTGKPLVEGKSITGFTDVGESILGVTDAMKQYKVDSISETAAKVNAKYLDPVGPWDDFTIADGRVMTGVNPQSAASLAKRVITGVDKK